MSHEKKKLRVYISLRRQTLWIMYIYYLFFKYEGGSNFKRVIHLLYIILSNLDFNQYNNYLKTYFHIS